MNGFGYPEPPNKKTCRMCELCAERRNVVPNKVVRDCKILFVAEAPGEEEDAAGTEPLIGRAGQYFRRVLAQLGLPIEEMSLVNTAMCRPPNNRDPNAAERAACRPFMDKDISEAQPKVICVLGRVAAEHIAGFTAPITAKAGEVVRHDSYPQVPIVLCVHPSAVLRDPKNSLPFIKGIKAAAELAGYTISTPVETDTDYRLVSDRESFQCLIEQLETSTRFALDSETTGKDNLWNGHVLCIQFSTAAKSGWVVPMWEVNDAVYPVYEADKRKGGIENFEAFCEEKVIPGPTLHPIWQEKDLVDRLKAVLMSRDKLKFIHNAAFDRKWFRKEGLEISDPVGDTEVGHYLWDATKNTHSLEYLSEVVLKMPAYKYLSERRHEDDSYAFIPRERLYQYGSRDPDAGFRLGVLVEEELTKRGMLTLWTSLISPATDLISRIETKGIGFDMNQSKTVVLDAYQGEHNKALGELTRILAESLPGKTYGDKTPEKFWRSKEVQKLFFEELKLPVIKLTEKKQVPALDEEVLEELAMRHPIPKALQEWKGWDHSISNFIVGYQERCAPDGRIHPHLFLDTTDTGRLSARDPNSQNVKNQDEDQGGVGLRSQFIPSPGRVFLEVDYSKAEIVVAAELSQDPEMIAALTNEADQIARGVSSKDLVDFHDNTAMKVMHVPFERRREKAIRKMAKRGTFLVLYGGEAKALVKTLKCTPREAEDFITTFWSVYHVLANWKAQTIAYAKVNGYVSTAFGRWRELPNLHSSDKYLRLAAERQAANTPIQGHASDLTLFAACKIHNEAQGTWDFDTVNLVHDSILWEINPEHVLPFARFSRGIMENPPNLKVPMRAEFGQGKHWGDIQPIERKLLFG